jgi:hypothetical protein
MLRTVKVWREGKLVSSIRMPDSVWSVAALDNGDIVTACADGVTRVFTQADERTAPAEELQAYTTLVANKTMQLKSALGGLQVHATLLHTRTCLPPSLLTSFLVGWSHALGCCWSGKPPANLDD